MELFLKDIQDSVPEKMQKRRRERIEKILKTSSVLFIVYLSLFKEHQGAELQEHQIIDFMQVVGNFLKELPAKKPVGSSSTAHSTIEETWYDLIHSLPGRGDSSEDIATAWRTVEIWIKKNRPNSYVNSSNPKFDYLFSTRLVIMKILVFSNL
jgi:hypothetical protein